LMMFGAACTAASAVGALHATHRSSAAMTRSLLAVAKTAPPGDGGHPIVVTTAAFLPREQWPTFPSLRWLLVPAGHLGPYASAMAGSGVDRFVLVTAAPSRQSAEVRSYFRLASSTNVPSAPQWHVLVLSRRP
jgi:hypothetical protein